MSCGIGSRCAGLVSRFISLLTRIIHKIIDLMLDSAQLILFFDIYDVVKLAKSCQIDADVSIAQSDGKQRGTTSIDQEVQTELHPTPYNKDENYVWNLWDFRRKAIELVSFASVISVLAVQSQTFPAGKSPSQANDFGSDHAFVSQA